MTAGIRLPTLLGLWLAGCALPRPAAVSPAPDKPARFTVADGDFYLGDVGVRAVVSLDAINGLPTGAWRLHPGGGAAAAGPVRLLVRLWAQPRLMGAPDASVCLRLDAEPETAYAVAATLSGGRYLVSVHDVSFNPAHKVADVWSRPGCRSRHETARR